MYWPTIQRKGNMTSASIELRHHCSFFSLKLFSIISCSMPTSNADMAPKNVLKEF